MFDVRAVVELREHAQQSDAADRPPADELDQAVGRIGLGRDKHRAAGKFAVAEGKKKAAALVPIFVFIASQTKGAAAQLNDADEDTEQIAEITERLEVAIGQRTNISGETKAEKIERINFAFGVRQANQIDGAHSAFDQGFERSARAVLCKIAQERIACSERQKSKCDALLALGALVDSVQNFVCGAVAADGDEAAISLFISFAGKFDGVARACRGNDVDLETFLAQASEGRPGEFRRAAATGGR